MEIMETEVESIIVDGIPSRSITAAGFYSHHPRPLFELIEDHDDRTCSGCWIAEEQGRLMVIGGEYEDDGEFDIIVEYHYGEDDDDDEDEEDDLNDYYDSDDDYYDSDLARDLARDRAQDFNND